MITIQNAGMWRSTMMRLRTAADGNGVGKPFKARLMLLVGGSVAAQVVALVASPVLARLFGPTAFGIYGVYLAVLGMLGAAASWRAGAAIPLPASDDDALSLMVAGTVGSFALTGILSAGVFFEGPWIALHLLRTPGIEPLLWLVPVGVLGAGLTDVLTGWCLRYQQFGPLVRVRVTRSAGTNLGQCMAGLALRLSPVGLLGGDVLGRFLGIFSLVRLVLRAERGQRTRVSKASIRKVISRYRAFALISTPSTLINTAGIWVPVFMLTLWWGPAAAGLYTIGQRVIGAPLGLIGDSVGQVYASEIAIRSRTDLKSLRLLFAKTARALLLLGLPVAILVLFLAPAAFRIIFGTQWAEAGAMLQWQSVAIVGQLVAVPLSQTLSLLDLQHHQFGWDLSRLVLTVLGFVLAHHLHTTAVGSMAIYGIVAFVAYMGLVVLGWRAVRQTSGNPL